MITFKKYWTESIITYWINVLVYFKIQVLWIVIDFLLKLVKSTQLMHFIQSMQHMDGMHHLMEVQLLTSQNIQSCFY